MSASRVNFIANMMRDDMDFMQEDIDEMVAYSDFLNERQREVLSKVAELYKDFDKHLLLLIGATSI